MAWKAPAAVPRASSVAISGAVACEPVGGGSEHRCRVDDQDLSRVVLYNGGGRATANATPELLALDQQARSARVGIWSRGDDDD